MISKSALISTWKRHDFKAKKTFGQSFLIDSNIKDRIIKLIDPINSDRILEIGPGFGEMTLDLSRLAAHVTAVEKDRLICSILKEESLKDNKKLDIIQQDILEFGSFNGYNKVVGNLPYYITTPIIEKLIFAPNKPKIFIMVQAEYGKRIVAGNGSKDYSSLSCFIKYYTEVKKHLDVSKTCFFPQPKVDSCFIEIAPREVPAVLVSDEELFFRIIRGSFSQRRKTICASLCGQGIVNETKERFKEMLSTININVKARPEELSLENFKEITDIIKENRE